MGEGSQLYFTDWQNIFGIQNKIKQGHGKYKLFFFKYYINSKLGQTIYKEHFLAFLLRLLL